MIIHVCNRCGEQITERNHFEISRFHGEVDRETKIEMDLCDNCMGSFAAFASRENYEAIKKIMPKDDAEMCHHLNTKNAIIGYRLRTLRENRGETREHLALELGFEKQEIIRSFENGMRKFKPQTIRALAKHFGVNEGYFYI